MLFLAVETSILPLAPGPELATITFSLHLNTTVDDMHPALPLVRSIP